MRHLFIVLSLFLLPVALCAGEAKPGKPPVTAAVSAHAPNYADKKLWTDDDRKSYHAQEKHAKGRLWIWSRPGQKVRIEDNPMEPKNWIEDGKPATQPMDENTDIEFPDSDQWYWVNLPGSKGPITWRRHLTVGKGCGLTWLHGAKGNTWVKPGAKLQLLGWFSGDKHAFYRNDNKNPGWMIDHVYCDKDPKASLEILGELTMDDSYHFSSGMTILGVDSILTPQARSTLNVTTKAAFAMLSGSSYRKQANQTFGADLIVHGSLLAGLPERPLTKDCTLGLSWKGKRRFLGGQADTYRCERQDDVALYVLPEATFTITSKDPKKARMILDWNGQGLSGETKKGPNGDENFAKLEALKDQPIEMYLLGKLSLDGLVLNHIGKEGIIVKDPAEVKTWKNVVWGDKNAGKPETLLRAWDGKQTYMFTTGDF